MSPPSCSRARLPAASSACSKATAWRGLFDFGCLAGAVVSPARLAAARVPPPRGSPPHSPRSLVIVSSVEAVRLIGQTYQQREYGRSIRDFRKRPWRPPTSSVTGALFLAGAVRHCVRAQRDRSLRTVRSVGAAFPRGGPRASNQRAGNRPGGRGVGSRNSYLVEVVVCELVWQTFLALGPRSIAQYGLFKGIKADVRLANECIPRDSNRRLTYEAKKA